MAAVDLKLFLIHFAAASYKKINVYYIIRLSNLMHRCCFTIAKFCYPYACEPRHQSQLKNPMTSSGTEPATYWLVT
jgi:hypothetical protein